MTALTTPPAGEDGETPRELAQRVIDTWGDGNPPIVILARALLSSEVRRVREALLISRGFVVAALEAHPDMKGLDVNDHLVVREIDAALSPQGG